MSGLYLEDYTAGRVFETVPVTLNADEIIWFAELHDPQLFHTDPEAAKESAFGEHVASGFQTVAIATGQFISTGAVDGTGLGGPGMDKIRWTAPVRPGETLSTRVEILEARLTRSDPGRGVVTLGFSVETESGLVLTFEATIFVRSRAGGNAD
ncbi:MAG: acyl dehydratase [Rhodospirillaceae bacterium]|nr:acyl dehydratase [Rhodospirillaceae bacterium]